MTATIRIHPVDRRHQAATLVPDPRPSADLTVTAHPESSGVVVIRVLGEVDLATSPLLLTGLLARLQGPTRQMVVDLTAVGFFGAAGLTVLATVRRAALAVGTGLCLVARTRPVLLPLTITGMDTLYDIYPDLLHALLHVGGGGPDG